MPVELMIVLIVLIMAVASIYRAKHGIVRRGRHEHYIGPARDAGEAEQLRGEVRALKDRIAVLERIVTDSDQRHGIALEREIEALRQDKEAR